MGLRMIIYYQFKDYPGRFFFHALPNFFNRDEVVSESRNLFERGFRGLKLCGGHLLGKVDLDDEVFFLYGN